MPYRVILFDLFRTVAVYGPAAPTGKVHEPTWRSAMVAVRPLFARVLPDFDFEQFLDALIAASDDIARQRPPDHRETPIVERYGRALERLGVETSRRATIAERLALAQLETQIANAEVPPAHRELLEELAGSFRIGLVSNFDHGPSVGELLHRYGLDEVFSAVVISIDFGRRKPHPAIFREALDRLSARASETLFVGDSPRDDVVGASAAKLDTAWVRKPGRSYPPGLPEPTYVLNELVNLRQILGGAT